MFSLPIKVILDYIFFHNKNICTNCCVFNVDDMKERPLRLGFWKEIGSIEHTWECAK